MDPSPKMRKKEARELRKQIVQSIEEGIKANDKTRKPRYYYLRDVAATPIVTVCEIGYEGKTYRGIAVCSENDCVRKSTGRNIAFNRAVAVIMAGRELFPVGRDESFIGLECVGLKIEDWDNYTFHKGQIISEQGGYLS